MRRMLIAALLAVGCAAAVARADLVDDLIAGRREAGPPSVPLLLAERIRRPS